MMITSIAEIVQAAPPFYRRYIERVEGMDLLELLELQKNILTEFYWDLPADRLRYRYAPGKWSIKEIFGHMIDTERIMAYRLLRFSRKDQTALPGFEEDDYVASADFDAVPDEQLLAEMMAVRDSSLFLLRNLPADAWNQGGMASGNYLSVPALACILAGHVEHHLQVMRERYI